MLFAQIEKRKVVKFPVREPELRKAFQALGVGLPEDLTGVDLSDHGFIHVELTKPPALSHPTRAMILDKPKWVKNKLTCSYTETIRPFVQLATALVSTTNAKLDEPFEFTLDGETYHLPMAKPARTQWERLLTIALASIQEGDDTPLPLRLSSTVSLKLPPEKLRAILRQAFLRNLDIQEQSAEYRALVFVAQKEGDVTGLGIPEDWWSFLPQPPTE